LTEIKIFNPHSLPAPKGYSHGALAPEGRLLFVAGQIGCDTHGALVSADLAEQFERALLNMMEVVRAAGGDAGSVVRLDIYVTDAVQYRTRLKSLGEAYRRVMGKHFPAMALVEVNGLFEPTAKVEVEATAVIPRGKDHQR